MAEQPQYPLDTCTSCQAQIIWGRTAMGRNLPVDASPAAGGTVALQPGSGVPVTRPGRSGPPAVPPQARVVPAKLAFGRTDLRCPHWASCPYANSHRRKGVRR